MASRSCAMPCAPIGNVSEWSHDGRDLMHPAPPLLTWEDGERPFVAIGALDRMKLGSWFGDTMAMYTLSGQ